MCASGRAQAGFQRFFSGRWQHPHRQMNAHLDNKHSGIPTGFWEVNEVIVTASWGS
jgi:hypothetical protein